MYGHSKRRCRQRQADTHVTHHTLEAGHGWAPDNLGLDLASTWMAKNFDL